MAFTPEQKIEIGRMSPERRVLLTDSKLEKHSVPSLKARVNIIGVSDTVEFAPENDYSAADIALIEAVKPRDKWMIAVPQLLEGAEVLRSEGMSEAAIALSLNAK